MSVNIPCMDPMGICIYFIFTYYTNIYIYILYIIIYLLTNICIPLFTLPVGGGVSMFSLRPCRFVPVHWIQHEHIFESSGMQGVAPSPPIPGLGSMTPSWHPSSSGNKYPNGKKGTQIYNDILPDYQPLSLWEEKKQLKSFYGVNTFNDTWWNYKEKTGANPPYCLWPLSVVTVRGRLAISLRLRHYMTTPLKALKISQQRQQPETSFQTKTLHPRKQTCPLKKGYITIGKYIFQLPTIDFQGTFFKVFRMLCIYKGSKSQRLSMKQTHDASLQTWGRGHSRLWFHGIDRTKSPMEPQAIE